jgi:hypothetical protein
MNIEQKIIICLINLGVFALGFLAGYTDFFGYLKSILKKKNKFTTGYPAPPDKDNPNDGNRTK